MMQFCLKLIKAETESELIQILESYSISDADAYWRNYGDNDSNESLIGSQQEASGNALVEKITNAVDAVMMRKSYEAKINPSGPDAPQTVIAAQKAFFKEYFPLTRLTSRERQELASKIQIVVTGQRGRSKRPSVSIIDAGEGQTPNRMPDTFLSLLKDNKAKIHFVQGVFNMGSTGTFKFCGTKNFQLILSKRATTISDISDDSFDKWGFTLVKIFPAIYPMRKPVYKYLVHPNDNKVPQFQADTLSIRPEYGGEEAYFEEMKDGSYIKLYEYDLPPGARANVETQLTYKLNGLYPEPALPIMIYERRDYAGEVKKYPGYLEGIKIDLEGNSNLLQSGFPSGSDSEFEGHKISYDIYAFKRPDMKKRYSEDAIIYTRNGQKHAGAAPTFLTRGKKLSHIKDHVIAVIDLTSLPIDLQTNLIMNSRDRLRKGELKKKLEILVQDLLMNHEGLKEFNQKIKEDKANKAIEKHDSTINIIQELLNEPLLAQMLRHGRVIHNPLRTQSDTGKEEYRASDPPTFFSPRKEYPLSNPKVCHIGSRIYLEYETDARNDYFSRSSNKGKFAVQINDMIIYPGKGYTWKLWNGIFRLILPADDFVEEGEMISVHFTMTSHTLASYTSEVFLKYYPAISNSKSQGSSKPKKPKSREEGEKGPELLNEPNINDIFEKDWKKHSFQGGGRYMNSSDAGYAVLDDEGFTIYINWDCVYVKGRLFNINPNQQQMYHQFYRTAMTLFTMTYVNKLRQVDEADDENEIDIELESKDFMDGVSVSLIPVLIKIIALRDEMST